MQEQRPTLAAGVPGKDTTDDGSAATTPDIEPSTGRERRGPEIKVALISAAATIVGALIAAAVAINSGAVDVAVADSGPTRDELRDKVASLEEDNGNLRTTVTSLQEKNDSLQNDNEELQASLDEASATDGDSTFPPSDPSAPPAEVFRETSGTAVVFAYGYCIDLDSREPDWEVGSDSGGDVCLSGGLNASHVAIVDKEPTLADCQAQTLLSSGVSTSRLQPGLQLCVTTGEGRNAYLRVAAVGSDLESISLDIRVWKLPDE